MAMIDITLPDGTVNEYAAGITCGEVIIDALGKKHGCVAAKVDGSQRDLTSTLNTSCSVVSSKMRAGALDGRGRGALNGRAYDDDDA